MTKERQSPSEKVCVVTGGSGGIGLAAARRFARENYRIAICGRNSVKLDLAAKEIDEEIRKSNPDANPCYVETADFQLVGTAGAFVSNTATKFGRIDVLVNCAGYAPLSSIEVFPDADFESAINVNCRAVYETTKAAWPTFVAQQSGAIINISSLAAIDPFPGFSVYGGCKSWVDTFTQAIANEGEPSGIHAVSIRPGAVATEMLFELFPDFPLEQTLDPAEVADLIWKVAQPDASGRSGQAITIQK